MVMKKIWIGMAAFVGLMAAFATAPVSAYEVLTFNAGPGRYKIQGGFYPNYFVFMKGLDPAGIETHWVDKAYWAVIDFHSGPQAGQSAIIQLKKSTERSPQPQWCKTEGGEQFSGEGVACLKGFDDYRGQLRFKVIAKWADDAPNLPEEFQDRNFAEYPELPGRGEGEVLEKFDLHIIKN